MTIGKQIKQSRASLGLTQQALADQLSVSQPLVAQWETGRSQPTDENLEKLVEIFGQPIFSTFGAWVRETRAAKEWTQAQLAATAGLSAQTINFIEIGKTQNPRDATRQRIEKALNANYEGQDNSENEESSRGEDSIIGELIEFNPHDPGIGRIRIRPESTCSTTAVVAWFGSASQKSSGSGLATTSRSSGSKNP